MLSDKNKTIKLLFLFSLLVLLGNIFNVDVYFLSDDVSILNEFYEGKHDINWERTFSTFTGDWRAMDMETLNAAKSDPMYRPLTRLIQVFSLYIFDIDPIGFHLVNFLLQIANTFLVYFIGVRLLPSKKMAFFAAMLFSIFPAFPEVVTWISGLSDLLFTMFSLSAVYFYVSFLQEEKKNYYYLSILFYLFSLMSKESALYFPAFILVYQIYFLYSNRAYSKKILSYHLLVFAGITLIYLGYRYLLFGTVLGIQGGSLLSDILSGQLRINFLLVFKMILFPFNNLNTEYNSSYDTLTVLMIFVYIVFLINIVYNIITKKIKYSLLLFLIMTFFVSQIPVLKGIDRASPGFDSLFGTRFIYLPFVFWSMMFAYIVFENIVEIFKRIRMKKIYLSVKYFFIVLLLITLWINNIPWKESSSIIKEGRILYKHYFGYYNGKKPIKNLPTHHKSTYLALFGTSCFTYPVIKEGPKPENYNKYDMIYNKNTKSFDIVIKNK